MEQLSFFDPVNKATPGAKWWVGNWQCRNFNGYFQQREEGRGAWQFVIFAFGDDDADIYAIDDQGALFRTRCLMDDKDNLVVLGKCYCRAHWCH